MRTPAHCNTVKQTSTERAMALTAGSSDGINTAENSPIAIVKYPRTAQ
jgi:hypothetical protein